MICVDNRIIQAIGKHIIAEDALAGRNQCIGIDESADLRIVITGLEVVERGLSLLGLTARPIYTQSVPIRNRGDFVLVH